MGNTATSARPTTLNQVVRFIHLDTKIDKETKEVVSETEWTGEAELIPNFDGEGPQPTSYNAYLIQAWDDSNQPYLDLNDGLREAFEQAAIDAFYNPPYLPITLPTDGPPNGEKPRSITAKIAAIEVEVNGISYSAIADTDLITHESGATHTHTEFLYAVGEDGKQFNPADALVSGAVREALQMAAFKRYHNIK